MPHSIQTKPAVKRFSFSAVGLYEYHLTCNLNESVLSYWPETTEDPDVELPSDSETNERKDGQPLGYSKNKYLDVKLTQEQIAHMESLLTEERIVLSSAEWKRTSRVMSHEY